MAERRLTCGRCPSYDQDARRCLVGKANPRRKHESLTVAEMFGPQALCLHNPHREPLLLRMRFPHKRFDWNDLALPVSSGNLDVTILEDEI